MCDVCFISGVPPQKAAFSVAPSQSVGLSRAYTTDSKSESRRKFKFNENMTRWTRVTGRKIEVKRPKLLEIEM